MPERISEDVDNSAALSEQERTLYIGEENPIRISSGHRLLHHEGKCSRPHGHNYRISVEISGTLTAAEGWVVDKGDVEDIIDEWDHKFLVEQGDPLIEAFERSDDRNALVVLDCPPTAEAMAVKLEEKLKDRLPDNITTVSVAVRETAELNAAF
ncbi:6-pyruvoyl tetrahydropterin synthase family protein [Salinarchaeum sp. IM2453]|uniref:6-pyruvoyl trahydropterin synthase family protein n=1 Tax=Salinarchaeum sp. IM2453 TaxID=2862870 RepID=UPI001C83E226|nr:6-pyruvoyl tetrahydropterin synthase family protein [Salinarchaeum sp. IM2453]QZA87753.1 6-pyruvoyl tetrahydropterin synthase family protein [Salinarchaeum sp. IM2453]